MTREMRVGVDSHNDGETTDGHSVHGWSSMVQQTSDLGSRATDSSMIECVLTVLPVREVDCRLVPLLPHCASPTRTSARIRQPNRRWRRWRREKGPVDGSCYNTDPIIYTLQRSMRYNCKVQNSQVETHLHLHLHRFTLVAALETCCAGASGRTPGRPQSVPRVSSWYPYCKLTCNSPDALDAD